MKKVCKFFGWQLYTSFTCPKDYIYFLPNSSLEKILKEEKEWKKLRKSLKGR